jgi:Tfp pilus assembly protein PilF
VTVTLVTGSSARIFAGTMRTTASFEIFPDEPSERELSRARWLRRQGQFDQAETAYRTVIQRQPGLRTGWMEYFDLLRSTGKTARALTVASEAERRFAAEAFPLALKAAALIEQGKFRHALQALELAVERDPNLALTWHELGYAAYRLGDRDRALLALDRAFALEPHTETLLLRGRILRDAGEFFAAEVAFEAAAHSATHDDQRAEALWEIDITRRFGAFTPRRPRELTLPERWFARHGAVVLASAPGGGAPTTRDLVATMVDLVHDRMWSFGQLLAVESDPAWEPLIESLHLPVAPPTEIDVDRIPLLIAQRPAVGDAAWAAARAQIDATRRGTTFVAWHPLETAPDVDIVGGLEQSGEPLPLLPNAAGALVMAQHPGARVAGRSLRFAPTTAGAD